ncbi:hypothetical protein, partial [Parafannyhessea umbonata]|uniref:hypothetical protein n=1 Tax=Parafannyhessea umbonata TaxID=604330 RepID=UPI00359C8183
PNNKSRFVVWAVCASSWENVILGLTTSRDLLFGDARVGGRVRSFGTRGRAAATNEAALPRGPGRR